PSQTCRSRNSMRKRPLTTRKSSSSWSWGCQTNGPWNLTSFTCWPFNSPTTFGFHGALNSASFSARLSFSGTILLPLLRPPVHALPRRSQEVDGHGEGFLEPDRGRHRQVERERHGRLALRHEEVAGEPAPALVLVEGGQARLADQQSKIDIALFSKEV